MPLDSAPLVRVIAQIRFPVIASIEKRDFIASFQESIRDAYPILRQEQTQGLVMGPQGIAASPGEVIWRFHELDGAWRVSLAPGFVALETTKYTSRNDFLERLAVITETFREHIGTKVIDRIGIRYIDRIEGDAAERVQELVQPEVLGALATPAGKHARHSISESVFQLAAENAQLKARWGCIPPNGTVDPAALEPVETRSWILDLDMFRAEQEKFDPVALLKSARAFTERIYTVFRWAVTDEFLREFGGKV